MERILTERPSNLNDLNGLLGRHSESFDQPLLLSQLQMLPTLGELLTIASITEALNSAGPTVRRMLSECVKLCVLILSAPTSVATAERSFSHLRFIKNYLRSTMGQSRLTHLMILHLFRQESRKLCKEAILHEFSNRCSERKSVFG